MLHAPATNQAVPLRTKLLYGIGQAGAQIFRDTPAVLLPVFMITMLGVPAWLAGMVVLLPKLWVIVCDLLMGNLSDRLEARHGRAPLLAIGAVAAAAGFMALFAFTTYSTPTIAAITICILFLLASTGFSAFSVPYLALAAELSDDAHERTRILVFRMVFTILGVTMGVGLAQPLVFQMGGGEHGWRWMGILFGLFILATTLTTALGFWRFRARHVAPQGISLKAQLRVAVRNRPFRLLTGMQFIQTLAQAAGYSVVALVFIYAVGNIALLPVFILIMSAGSLISQPFWTYSSAKYGKLRMFVLASLAWTAITVSWFFLGKAGTGAVAVPGWGPMPVEEVLVLVRGFLIGMFNSGFVLLAISMLTDTMNHGRAKGDLSADGALAGIFTATEKLAFAVGPAIAGLFLSFMGMKSSTGGAIAQDADAISGILLLYSLIPAALCLTALLLLRNYQSSFVDDR